MAASITKSEKTFEVIKKISWAWLAHTDGKVATTTANAATTEQYNGEIVRAVFVPKSTNAPSDNYTVIIYDDDGVDVLMGAAVGNRDNAAADQLGASSLGIVAYSKLTLYVEGAGDGNEGTVHLYVR
jgi:hypothetical protein